MAEEKRIGRTRAQILHDRRFREVRREFAAGNMPLLLGRYLAFCGLLPSEEASTVGEENGAARKHGSAGARNAKPPRLPNPAGFCRFLELSREAYGLLEAEFPTEAGRMRAVFEDEALNSSLSASVLGFYFKLLFGSDGEETEASGGASAPILVTFAHDILEDGR